MSVEQQPIADSPTTAERQPTSPDAHDVRQWNWLEASPGKLALGAAFGVVFGFLLQKGGAATFDILIGVLLLENFVVVKIMLSAIVVGMIGVYLLRRVSVVELQISETKYGANVIGGLIFGVGFGLLAYCPGTCAAAIGQGNLDAIVGLVGLVVGSYLYALSSKFTNGSVSQWGKAGKITIPQLLNVPTGACVAVAAPLLIGVLLLLEWLGM